MMEVPDLLESGIFTVDEAAQLVGVSKRRIRGWISGYKDRSAGAIIENEIGWSDGRLAFSFRNLMEMRFIACFEKAGVTFNNIRAVMDEVRIITRRPHPFSTNIVFKTDGKKIVGEVFSKIAGRGLYDLRTKNMEIFDVVYMTLKDDVVYDFNGDARSWFPRRKVAPNVIVHPKFAFGEPILKRSFIPTRTIYDTVAVEKNNSLVADMFDIPPPHVREAVAFERELRKAA